jgi:hypothetical protein
MIREIRQEKGRLPIGTTWRAPAEQHDRGARLSAEGQECAEIGVGREDRSSFGGGKLEQMGICRRMIAAMLVAAMLLIGAVAFALAVPGLALRNWLVVLFGINGGAGGLSRDSLRLFNPFDVALLVLVGVTFLGLWPALGRANRTWMAIAVALPFAGIAVLAVTNLAGRSSVMGAGLVIAFLMSRSRASKRPACLGILANALLLAGDLATAAFRGLFVAALVGIGYALLIAWFLWIGARLLGWGR